MKKLFVFFTILMTAAFTVGVFASDGNVKTYNWGDKLKRGSLNIVSSPVEIARQIQITSDEKSLLSGWTVGLAKGLGTGILRLGAGIVDLFTFPFNFPNKEKAPLIQPEYVWEKPGVKYT